MNRIISINISGFIFNVDEEAFVRLQAYLDFLHKHFTKTQGGDEILADIEARISEMLLSRLSDRKEVVTMNDVEYIISVMGKPEELEDETETMDESEQDSKTNSNWQEQQAKSYRRIYRDPDDKVLGGVCGGIAAYFLIDPLWIRLAFLIGLFTFGTGFLLYIALWIIIPVAKSAAEKLEMRGEPVNISNIEKTVKENLKDVKQKLNEWGNEVKEQFNDETYRANMKNSFRGLGENLSSFIVSMSMGLGRTIAVLLMTGSILVFIFLIAIFTGFNTVASFSFPPFLLSLFSGRLQMILAVIGILLVMGIPFLQILYWSLRRLLGIKKRNKIISYSFNLLWASGIILTGVIALSILLQFSRHKVYVEEYQLRNPARDTMYISSRYLADNGLHLSNVGITVNDEDTVDDEFNDLGKVSLNILRSNTPGFVLEKSVKAYGRTKKQAYTFAKEVLYNFIQKDSLLTLDESFSLGDNKKWRAQRVNLILKVPVGKVIVLKQGLENILYDVPNVNDELDKYMINHAWRMTDKGLQCADCPR